MALPPKCVGGLAERPHWTVAHGNATFAPVPAGWRATLRWIQSTRENRYHVAILDQTGAIRFTMETANLSDAIRNAEHGVLARNALRLTSRG